MDYGVLPPEINSSRMYAGAGSGSMIAASEAWQSLAAELHSAANSYQSVVSGLTSGSWSGPSSASMAAAASSYTAWLTATATQAEQSAAQAKAAVAAYQSAFSATVPPQMVAINRSQLATLVATNLFGLNTQAIAANEAQYGEMWAQDSAAMYTYAASSAAATSLTAFTPPQQNTNPGGSASQAAAAGQASGTSAGNAATTVQQAMSAVPNSLQSLATAAPAATSSTTLLDDLDLIADLVTIFLDLPADLVGIFIAIPLGIVGIVSLPFDISSFLVSDHTDDIISGWDGVKGWPEEGAAPVTDFPAPLTGSRPIVAAAPSLAAGLGEANVVGGLSVPPTWAVATPAVRPVSYTLPALPQTTVTASAAGESGSAGTLSQVALAGMAGRAMAGTIGTGGARNAQKTPGAARAAARVAEATGSRAAATGDEAEVPKSKPRAVVTGVAAELREFAKLRDEGILTDAEYTEQKNRLLGR